MPKFSIDQLNELAAAAFRAHGAADNAARITAKYLVEADAQGLGTHGVARVPAYCDHLKHGRAFGDAVPKIANERGAACLIDAGLGLGFEPTEFALKEGVARAAKHGVSFVGVTRSHHCGALGILLEPVAERGMVGIAFSNAPSAIMAWGGTKPIFGTNPIAAIFPRKNGAPLVIDMSLTQVTRGQILLYKNAGKQLPEGWGMDKDGKPTTDPEKILIGGSLHAVGGMKGTMLAFAVEILCCALMGASLSHQVEPMLVNNGKPMDLGQAFLVIDPAALAGEERYLERVETLIAAMLEDEGVRLPGARRVEELARAKKEGIAIPAELAKELHQLAQR